MLDLFSGLGGFSLAFSRAGFDVAAHSEIEPFPCRVLDTRFPGTMNLGDVTKWPEWDWDAIGDVDVVTFGSPCQDLSVAGKRAGITGERSGLFYDAVGAIRRSGARFALWENVPGAFSSAGGRDFGTVLDALADAGALDVAWRVLDAQFFGVPQRRRRIFLVADFGGERASEILFEPEGVRRDSPPGRESGKEVAGTLGGGSGSRGWAPDTDRMTFVPEVSQAMAGSHRIDAETETFVTHALTGEGFDASEDGTGRGTPLVPTPFDTTQITSALNYSRPQAGDPCHPLASGAHPPAIAFHSTQDPISGDVSPALGSAQGISTTAVAFAENQRGEVRTSDIHPQLTTGGGKPGQGYPAVQQEMAVRRLTPMECERLQGYPDSWTAIPGAADGPRYRALGNSVAVPVVGWVARRIANELQREQRAWVSEIAEVEE